MLLLSTSLKVLNTSATVLGISLSFIGPLRQEPRAHPEASVFDLDFTESKMRISIVDGDPGYIDAPLRNRYTILLDGVIVKYVLTADEELGMVEVYKTYETGELVLNEAKSDLVTEKKMGRVKLVDMHYMPTEKRHRNG
jgi:hypothetical protein